MFEKQTLKNREPLKERYLQITQKLNNVEVKEGNCKAHRIDKVNQRSLDLVKRIQQLMDYHNKLVNQQKETINKIIDKYEEQKTNRSSEEQEILELQKQMEERIEKRIQEEKQKRELLFTQFETYLSEKNSLLESELYNESRLRNEMIDDVHYKLEHTLPKLYASIQQQVDDRINGDNVVIKKANQEIKQLEIQVQNQVSKRNDSEKLMINLLQDLIYRTQADLSQLKEERVKSHEVVIEVIDNVCDKMIQISKE